MFSWNAYEKPVTDKLGDTIDPSQTASLNSFFFKPQVFIRHDLPWRLLVQICFQGRFHIKLGKSPTWGGE